MKTAKQLRAEHVGEGEFIPNDDVKLHANPVEAAKAQHAMDALRFTGRWIGASVELPDFDTTVLLHCPVSDDPVWIGYHDGTTWRAIDGEAIDETLVDHWSQLPEGPKP